MREPRESSIPCKCVGMSCMTRQDFAVNGGGYEDEKKLACLEAALVQNFAHSPAQ